MQTYHLYSDGNYFPRAKKSGFGGYVESPDKEVIFEYSEQVKKPEYIHSFEILGIIRGLQLAQNHGIKSIISHCDDKTTIARLKEIFENHKFEIPPNVKPELYQEIVDLSKNFESVRFEYINRSLNKYADSLSRRYASIMEQNYFRQYDKDILFSERKLLHKTKTNKKIFFSHPSFIKNPYKNNPFMVSQHRNKKIRKVSKIEEKKPYHFLYHEIFTQNDHVVIRGFFYDQNQKLIKNIESKYLSEDIRLEHFLDFLKTHLETIQKEHHISHLWMYSNHRIFNSIFEQKEKIQQAELEQFFEIYPRFNSFQNVFFHHLPFHHQYSPEIIKTEEKKEKLDTEIEDLDNLLEKLQSGCFEKDQKKYFGAIVRYKLREFKKILERELNEIEKNEIIQSTFNDINKTNNLSFSHQKLNI